jgi:hypothetical protein
MFRAAMRCGAVAITTRTSIIAVCLSVVLGVTGCATFRPKPLEQIPFLERAQARERDGLRVTVSVPTREEARQTFGVDLEKGQIQPVWVQIENDTDAPFWFMLHGLDPNYYSAREAAYISHFRFRGSTNKKMDEHFEGLAIDQRVPPHGSTAGFAFSNLKLGTKEVHIRLFGAGRVKDFEFYVTVPGLRADWQQVDWHSLYSEDEFLDCEDEGKLREALAGLPLTTTRKKGTGRGDPLNLIIIGDLKKPFIKAGWDETEVLTAGSAWRTAKAFFGGEYKYSPMSTLYVFGRPQDVGFQKARDTIHERNHLRLWLTPLYFRGKDVWVGAISRDIGVYFTMRAWNLMTHAIDPNVDEARNYLIEDLATAQGVERIGWLRGVEPVTRDDPHRNLMNAPYWTDGRRVVLLLSNEPVPLEDIDFFEWESGSARQSREKAMQQEAPAQ